MINLITLAGNTVSVVSLPATSGAMASVDWNISDAVAIVSSPFTGQTQSQQWPGADMWSGTMTLPPLTQAQADGWIAALKELRGMANSFLLGDPMKKAPRGSVSGTPIVNVSIPMVAGGQILYTQGWTPSTANVLLPNDFIQVGYRLYSVLNAVTSDSSGGAALNIWPSLREAPTPGAPIITTNPVGLFRLATNRRTWSTDVTRLTKMSFPIQEYR